MRCVFFGCCGARGQHPDHSREYFGRTSLGRAFTSRLRGCHVKYACLTARCIPVLARCHTPGSGSRRRGQPSRDPGDVATLAGRRARHTDMPACAGMQMLDMCLGTSAKGVLARAAAARPPVPSPADRRFAGVTSGLTHGFSDPAPPCTHPLPARLRCALVRRLRPACKGCGAVPSRVRMCRCFPRA